MILSWLGGGVLFIALLFVLVGSEKDSQYYQEVREERMGALEKVRRGKDKKKHTQISQHRELVNRTVLRGEGDKQIFTLAALTADIRMKFKKDGVGIEEEFHHARGILQEEFYYILPGSPERGKIFLLDGKYTDDKGKPVLLTQEEIGRLRPYQDIRTFVSEKVVWDLEKDVILAYLCDFATYTLPSHTLPDDLFSRTPDSLGYANQMRVALKTKGGQQLTAEGLRMKMSGGVLPWQKK